MRALNLYAGLGGNRKLWSDCSVVAVESDERIASVYRRLYPDDLVIVGDAHEYLRENFTLFDFVWSSPPCQTHSKMNKATRHKNYRYPDFTLYEEIVFLKNYFKGKWVVENVVPYYEAMMNPVKVGRHLFWSNFQFSVADVERPAGFINKCNLDGKRELQNWLGIHYEENIYYGNNHCPAQILRNCVHPMIGKQIFDAALQGTKP